MSNAKKIIIKIIVIILALIIIIPVGFLGYLRIMMYTPEQTEQVEYSSGNRTISKGSSLSVLTFNIGYSGYNKDEDFFMDGGKGVLPESYDAVMTNLSGIAAAIKEADADIVFVQECDVDSKRSYHINEAAYLGSSLGLPRTFAKNYDVVYVPYPIPTMGKVLSGLCTFTDLNVTDAQRIALPEAVSKLMSLAYMKRCLLLERIPIENSEKELVIINLHLEAYTDEEKRDMQSKLLNSVLSEEYDKGNYVIAGGDFNQSFAGVNNPPILSETGWLPGEISEEEIPEGFSPVAADNAPTCRSLEKSFTDNETSQVYIIDGFIVSDNVEVKSIEVLDKGFEYSDHNPVRMEVRLR
jgi:endonuclease/exonuclease/phosphatase family metal-dependent hydrolase